MKKCIVFLMLLFTFCFCSCSLSQVDMVKQKKRPVKIGVVNKPTDIFIGYVIKNVIENYTEYDAKIEFYGEKLLVFTALYDQKIDVCVENGSTIYFDILGMRRDDEMNTNMSQICIDGLKDAFGIDALDEIGFSDHYVFCMKSENAQKYNIQTVTNILPYIEEFTFASDFDWYESASGYDAFFSVYGFSFFNTINIERNLAIDALILDEAEIICVNKTNPNIQKYKLYVIEDDKQVFIEDAVYPLMEQSFAINFPEIRDSVSVISGKIDEEIIESFLKMVTDDNATYDQASISLLTQLGLLRAD